MIIAFAIDSWQGVKIRTATQNFFKVWENSIAPRNWNVIWQKLMFQTNVPN